MGRRAFLLLLACACSAHEPQRDAATAWRPIEELNAHLPSAVRVFSLTDDGFPMRAWYVRADLSDPAVSGRVIVSGEPDRRQTVTSFARHLSALVAVNGGYFDRHIPVSTHAGVLLIDGQLVQGSTDRNPALGFDYDGAPDIAWVTLRGGELVELPVRVAELAAGAEVRPPRPKATLPWVMRDAVQAKPPLLFGGLPYVQRDDERHPRTAAGITAAGELVLLVVDGRQARSCGVTLTELAGLMLELGCVEALNLDGGGSSTLVVLGHRLNLPQGRAVEREVMSAVALVGGP